MSASQHSASIDFVRAMGPVAIELLGEPSQRSRDEYRFGTHGSMSVDLRKGTFYDHEVGKGGGVVDLVMSRANTDRPGAIQWLRDRRLLEPLSGNNASRIVELYDYTDADGVLLFQVCRKEPKDFLQRRPDREKPGGWIWKTKGIQSVIYRLPEVIEAVAAGKTIYIAEGEKGVNALRGLGFTATCSPGGAGEWRPEEHAAALVGADVIILPDNDEPGREHALEVATSLLSICARAARVRVLELPDLEPKGDVFDWISAGGTASQLDALAAQAPEASDWKRRVENVADVPVPTATSPTSWGDPVDFFSDAEILGAPLLTSDHVPEALWPFITDTAERMGVDPSTVALGALVCCASVISDDWKIQPKRFDFTWTECARLWGVIIGDPGILKSPVVSACTKPIDKLETEARKKHADEMRVWRGQEAEAKMMKVAAPPQPKRDRFMVESATPEALSEVLRDDEDGKMRVPCGKVLVRQDEMSEFFAGLDKYKSGGKGGSERGTYLRLYNGGRYTIDRIGRGSFDVPNWSAGFFGGVQPGPIQKIASDAADDGMLQRFLKVVPDKQRGGLDRSPDQAAITRYAALFPVLVALQPAPAMGSEHVRPIVFHADAHEHREAINRLAVVLAEMPDTSLRMKATFDKWPGTFARLCLTFHMIGIADCRVRGVQAPVAQVILESTARQVADFMREIILPHEQRAEAVMFNSAQSGHARWIAGFILSRNMGQISTRDIVRAYKALKAPEAARELEAVMASLVAVGWLEPIDPDNPVKRVSSWNVNPAVHVRFAERARAETKRREDARERVAEAVELIRKRKAA
jgi:hypothetical protein